MMFDSIILPGDEKLILLKATIVERFFDGTQRKSKHFVIFKLDFLLALRRLGLSDDLRGKRFEIV